MLGDFPDFFCGIFLFGTICYRNKFLGVSDWTLRRPCTTLRLVLAPCPCAHIWSLRAFFGHCLDPGCLDPRSLVRSSFGHEFRRGECAPEILDRPGRVLSAPCAAREKPCAVVACLAENSGLPCASLRDLAHLARPCATLRRELFRYFLARPCAGIF